MSFSKYVFLPPPSTPLSQMPESVQCSLMKGYRSSFGGPAMGLVQWQQQRYHLQSSFQLLQQRKHTRYLKILPLSTLPDQAAWSTPMLQQPNRPWNSAKVLHCIKSNTSNLHAACNAACPLTLCCCGSSSSLPSSTPGQQPKHQSFTHCSSGKPSVWTPVY